MIFSTRAPEQAVASGQQDKSAKDHERIVKATEYVEHAEGGALFRSYVVLETEEGNSVVIEMAAAGITPWAENPSDLDDRNSLAKVIRSQDVRSSSATVGLIRNVHVPELITGSSSTRFAQAVFCHATGEAERFCCRSGFRRSAEIYQQLRFAPASRVPCARFTPQV